MLRLTSTRDGVVLHAPTSQLRGHLANLRSRLFTLICNALETDNINAHLASTSAAASVQASRWARVRARFVAMFAAGPSKDALSSALIDLHEDLVEQVSSVLEYFAAVCCCSATSLVLGCRLGWTDVVENFSRIRVWVLLATAAACMV